MTPTEAFEKLEASGLRYVILKGRATPEDARWGVRLFPSEEERQDVDGMIPLVSINGDDFPRVVAAAFEMHNAGKRGSRDV